mmetsp:Transcript_38487/g.53433  ORF Transcript_38487/g.53433 Transcript_38487/m.53433 type:complete len:762 (+) Transcript_38487:110-2395(+)|eukprot:CAMPEP_0196576414 /NCGR_PEP_ID=MMETSP1081-20130531/5677_1 /TAXON_ID=36882 /ORGANISM="Pyramimonas amylifera, Strain CCMP720" /LENGTH=761 /DNA_ID=CAMNT_0041895009 /DNA_START=104 /DNA_END=2389 /DNA_ORIENTATION=+
MTTNLEFETESEEGDTPKVSKKEVSLQHFHEENNVHRTEVKFPVGYFDDFFIHGLAYRVINPASKLYSVWSRIIIVLVLYSSFSAPLRFGFMEGSVYDKYIAFDVLENIFDIMFLLDIILTFRVAYFKYGNIVTDKNMIAMHYISQTFAIDLLATLPLDLLGVENTEFLSLLRLMRLNRVLKMFNRLAQDYKYNYVFLSICKLSLLLVEAGHVAACCFFYIGNSVDNSWIDSVGQVDLATETLSTKYIYSAYWAFTTLTTVGYGDISPQTDGEKVFGSFLMVFNMAVTAYVLGTMTLIATKSDETVSEYRSQMAALDDLLKRKKVPQELSETALAQLQLSFDRREDRDDALEFCPQFMRNQIMKHLYLSHVKGVFLFKKCSSVFIDKLTSMTHVVFVHEGTRMMTEGEMFESIVYIFEGQVSMFHQGTVVQTLGVSDSFGQVPVICKVVSALTAVAKTYCRMLFFPHAAYAQLIEEFPEDGKQSRHNVLAKLAKCAVAQDPKDGTRKKVEPFNKIWEDCRAMVAKIDQALEPADPSALPELTTVPGAEDLPVSHDRICTLAARGDTRGLQGMLSKHPLNAKVLDYDKRTPLHLASSHGHLATVQLLLESNSDVNAKDSQGLTPLAAAVYKANWAAVGECLRSHGAQLLLPNEGEALCSAAHSWDSALIRRLCENGCDVNAANFDGRRAIHLAAAIGSMSVAQVLMEFKADVKVLDRWGYTAMDEAKLSGHQDIVNFLLKFVFDKKVGTETPTNSTTAIKSS